MDSQKLSTKVNNIIRLLNSKNIIITTPHVCQFEEQTNMRKAVLSGCDINSLKYAKIIQSNIKNSKLFKSNISRSEIDQNRLEARYVTKLRKQISKEINKGKHILLDIHSFNSDYDWGTGQIPDIVLIEVLYQDIVVRQSTLNLYNLLSKRFNVIIIRGSSYNDIVMESYNNKGIPQLIEINESLESKDVELIGNIIEKWTNNII